MEYLVHHEQIPPSSITLIGDSAGGNLLLGLILHLNHPNPSVSPLRVADRLSGAILVSPWVSMDLSSDSMVTNSWKDILSPSALDYWRQNFLGGSDPDPWNSPLMAPSEWWNNAPVEDILILYGDDEMFHDDISRLCRIIQANHLRTTSFSFPGEIHDHMLIHRFLGANKVCESEKAFVNWLNSHLGFG
jgi:acetyl esterase/lipase